MADVATNGWQLSDSDNEEDIFQLDIQASVNLDDDELPVVSTKPTKSETRNGEASPPPQPSYQPPPSRQRRHERNDRSERNDRDRHDRDSGPRRGAFFRRARADPDDDFVANDNGRSKPRYSMPFPTSAPFCAWFGNVASDIDNLEDELYEYFDQLNLVPKEIRFGNRASNNKTCCFVDFHEAADLRHALKHIDSPDAPRFYDLKLHVDIAEPRPPPGGGGRGRFGRGKRRSRHSAPMSVGNDEYHSHVNSRGRPAHSPPRRGSSGSDYRRRGRGGGESRVSQQHERRRRDSGPGTPRRPLARISSEESSIHDEPDFDRRRDRDSFKVNGPIRDRYDGPPSLRSVRPSGPSRHRQRRNDFDEAPRHSRSNARQQRRANPRENWNHTKRRGPSSSRKSGGRPGGKAPRSGNSRFSNMFD